MSVFLSPSLCECHAWCPGVCPHGSWRPNISTLNPNSLSADYQSSCLWSAWGLWSLDDQVAKRFFLTAVLQPPGCSLVHVSVSTGGFGDLMVKSHLNKTWVWKQQKPDWKEPVLLMPWQTKQSSCQEFRFKQHFKLENALSRSLWRPNPSNAACLSFTFFFFSFSLLSVSCHWVDRCALIRTDGRKPVKTVWTGATFSLRFICFRLVPFWRSDIFGTRTTKLQAVYSFEVFYFVMLMVENKLNRAVDFSEYYLMNSSCF